MSGNGQGNFRTSARRDMAAHDACPPLLRYAANYAVQNWASEEILKAWRFALSEQFILRTMRRGDAAETVRTYGPLHPEARHD